jgi:hypothetical protein
MKTLWRKNQENPSDRISHAWAPLIFLTYYPVAVGSHPQAAKHTADQLSKQKNTFCPDKSVFSKMYIGPLKRFGSQVGNRPLSTL